MHQNQPRLKIKGGWIGLMERVGEIPDLITLPTPE